MRIGDFLYFAPEIKFSELDLSGDNIARQYGMRIQGFYLEPAYQLCKSKHAFASGVLLVSCIDALAQLKYGDDVGVGERFKEWSKKELGSFNDKEIASRFYKDFRNGLVHETRIKNGGEFSLEQENTVGSYYSSLRINPLLLHNEIIEALSRYTDELIMNKSARDKFISHLLKAFAFELVGII